MRTLKITLSYDGTNYCGWQIQPNGPSIQAELSKAIAAITGENANPAASGRTDSGVHALAQVVAWRTNSLLPTSTLKKALNAQLPRDIRVRDLVETHPDFDPVRHATRKHYRYFIQDGVDADVFLRRFAWRIHENLDARLMDQEARTIEGKHDFRSFESEWPNRASSIRTVFRCRVSRLGSLVIIDAEADGFLYNMVRAIAGSLALVGRRKWSPGALRAALDAQNRTAAGPNAPACGLFLVRVEYDDRSNCEKSS
jgi:tRNA pseudouridine38-40 synthase